MGIPNKGVIAVVDFLLLLRLRLEVESQISCVGLWTIPPEELQCQRMGPVR